MKKLVIAAALALVVVLNFTATPARAEETVVEEAASEVIEAAMQIVPEKTRTLAKIAFWLGNESGCSATAGEMAMTLERAVRHIDLSEEERGFIKSVFQLGSAVAEAELEESSNSMLKISMSTDDEGSEELAPAEGLIVTYGENEDGGPSEGVHVIILNDNTDEPPIKMVE